MTATLTPPPAPHGAADGVPRSEDGTRLPTGQVPESVEDPDATHLASGTPPSAAETSTRSPTGAPTGGGPLAVGQNFGSRYHIIRLLGIGGMGAVYQAWDQVLEVAVAIKVIRIDPSVDPQSAADLEKRFKRELLLARQVTHKNVVRIHDLGEIDGIKYITMPYIQGADLASVLKREGRLPVSRALAIARQVVAGLVAAHEAGVVHRDLKPANIMLDVEEHACVMDFGIARSTSAATGFAMTMAGAVVGTVEYMAPEQAKGEAVDHRADIYAVGLILRDMLLGLRRHGAGTAMSELMTRMQQAPPSLRSVDPQIPEALDAVVSRCLQPDPGDRFGTTEELQAALTALDPTGHTTVLPSALPSPHAWRWSHPALLASAALLILVIAAGAWALWSDDAPLPPAAAVPERPVAIAVLPFRNASGDPSLDSLGSSLAEILLSELGQTAYLRTVPTERLLQVLDDLKIGDPTGMDDAMLNRLADLLSADAVVRASFLKFGNEIRVAGTLRHVKKELDVNLNANAADQGALLGAVDTLAEGIRQNIVPPDLASKLAAAPAASMSRNFAAVKAYTDGLALARQEKHAEAIERFRAATEGDSSFALAFARMARSYSAMGHDAEAERAAKTAVQLSGDASPADRYYILATEAEIRGDSDKAIEHLQQLVEAAPSDVMMRLELALALEAAGEYDGAAEQLQKVLAGDPNYLTALLAAGRVDIRRGDSQKALESLNPALTLAVRLQNDHVRADVLHAIGVAFKRLERPEEALKNYQESLAIKERLGNSRGMASSLSEIAQVQASLGQVNEALASFERSEQLRRDIGDRSGLADMLISVGTLYLELGRYDDALEASRESLQIQRDLGNHLGVGRALHNLGSAYNEKGQFADAMTFFEQALSVREKGAPPHEVSETVHNIAETYVRLGRFDRATENYLRALDLARKAGEEATAAIENYSLGTVFEYQGRYGAALKARREALDYFRKLNDQSFWHAEILAGYGRSLMLVGRFDDAAAASEEALRVAREKRYDAVVARVLNDTAERLRLSGDEAGARKQLDEANRAVAAIGDRALALRTEIRQALLNVLDRGRAAAAAQALGRLSQQADSQGQKYLAIEAALGRIDALLTAGQGGTATAELQRALARADNLGTRMLLARAHYLSARTMESAGQGGAAVRRHYGEAVRILEEMAREDEAAGLQTRADVARMLQDAKKALT